MIVCIAKRFQEYADSGSAAWAETLDMRDRPEWLVKAGQHKVEAAFDIGTFKVTPLDANNEHYGVVPTSVTSSVMPLAVSE